MAHETLDTSQIKEYHPGDRELRSQDLNTYTAFAQAEHQLPEGYQEGGNTHYQNVEFKDLNPLNAVPIFETNPYESVGVAFGGPADKEPQIVECRLHGDGEDPSPLTMYNVQDNKILGGKQGYIQPFTPGRRFFCLVFPGAPDLLPKLGHPCGVAPGTADTVVTNNFSGLVCLSKVTTRFGDISGQEGVWCSMPQADNLLCKVSETLTPFDPLTDTLGEGKVNVWSRKDGGSFQLREMVDPAIPAGGASPFEILVVNILEQEIAIDTIVQVHPYANVGMMAIPTTGVFSFIGWVFTSIPGGTPTDEFGTAGTTAGANIRLQRLGVGNIYENILDDVGSPIAIKSYNHCSAPIDAAQRVQGKWINGKPYVDVVCCPP